MIQGFVPCNCSSRSGLVMPNLNFLDWLFSSFLLVLLFVFFVGLLLALFLIFPPAFISHDASPFPVVYTSEYIVDVRQHSMSIC